MEREGGRENTVKQLANVRCLLAIQDEIVKISSKPEADIYNAHNTYGPFVNKSV